METSEWKDFVCEVDPKSCQDDFDTRYELNKHIMLKHPRTNYGIHLRLEDVEKALVDHKLLERLE